LELQRPSSGIRGFQLGSAGGGDFYIELPDSYAPSRRCALILNRDYFCAFVDIDFPLDSIDDCGQTDVSKSTLTRYSNLFQHISCKWIIDMWQVGSFGGISVLPLIMIGLCESSFRHLILSDARAWVGT